MLSATKISRLLPPEWLRAGIANSYAQVFFSDSPWFGFVLLVLTFADVYVGLAGLLAVCTALLAAYMLGLSQESIRKGLYGFNALLVGVGLGVYFQPSALLWVLIVMAALLALLFAVGLEGVLGKYGLPFLSLPFILVFWLMKLSTRQFELLGLSERGIYIFNELYVLGGPMLVSLYEWWNQLPLPPTLRAYFLSLGAIFFQQTVFAGVIASVGLLVYSRIGFTLSFMGFYIGYAFHSLMGIPFSEVAFSYIGFNYILTAIAVGGFFIIPGYSSFLLLVFLIPLVSLLGISLQQVLNLFYLPAHSVPFNIGTLSILYLLRVRTSPRAKLYTFFWQQNAPEKNLYTFANFMQRFGKDSPVPVYLPFFGTWNVTQGHNGAYTHKDNWRHAWDFEICNEQGLTYQGSGDYPADYYCFDKNILAPADGVVEEVVDNIEDNPIGVRNLEKNWGNTVVIKHAEFLYSKLSHLRQGSAQVKPGDRVKKGDVIGRCGNSGNSPYPHLHFQLQATPYIGSQTLDYPLTDVWIREDGHDRLVAVANPPTGAVVSAVIADPALKRAFTFTAGSTIELNTGAQTFRWEVLKDYGLNRYLRCTHTGAKAYFKTDEAMLHFTHFEGSRSSLLYRFYLAAYTVSFAYTSRLQLSDQFPIHLLFGTLSRLPQDFLAPFYRYLKATYTLSYPEKSRGLSAGPIRLEGRIERSAFGRPLSSASFSFLAGAGGLQEFTFQDRQENIHAQCNIR